MLPPYSSNEVERFRENVWTGDTWNKIWTQTSGPARTTDVTGLSTATEGLQGMISKIVYPSDFEKEFDGTQWALFGRNYWVVPPITALLYCIFVKIIGPKYMEKREAVSCNAALKYWNLFLAVFSLIGFLRTGPWLFCFFYQYGWEALLCSDANFTTGKGPQGLWLFLFIYSKYIELIDTVFLVIRKKPVNFLHWYHHSTVLLYCVHASQWQQTTGMIFCVMNYFVHAIMYYYYYLAAQRIFPKWAHYVTKLQLSQMVVGVATVGCHAYYRATIPSCDAGDVNLAWAGIMYFSYFLLFLQFYIQRYLTQKPANAATKTEKPIKKD